VRIRTAVAVVMTLAIVVTVGALVVVDRLGKHLALRLPRHACVVDTGSGLEVPLDADQMANAATVSAVGITVQMPERAVVVALATAFQESKLRNLPHGDRDSIGLFQQRPSMGWGTREQILDPAFATNRFYDALVKIDGYENLEITKVAQQVQKSAYPEAYADHEQEGRVLASTLRGHSPAGLGCQLHDITRASDGAAVAADLNAQLGVSVVQDGALLTVTAPSTELAWAAGQWAVARADAYGIDQVHVADRVWERGTGSAAAEWSTGQPGPTPTTVTIRIGAVKG
jgi:hypothetical protein